MNRNAVGQRNDPQYTILELFNPCPKAYAVVALFFDAYRVLNNKYTPFLSNVMTLSQYFIFEIGGEFVCGHTADYCIRRLN